MKYPYVKFEILTPYCEPDDSNPFRHTLILSTHLRPCLPRLISSYIYLVKYLQMF
jgi:hypothetical protein